MERCDHPICSKTRVRRLNRAHSYLCNKSRHYHAWHHYKHHKKIHFGALVLYIILVTSFLITSIGNGRTVLASDSSWAFGSAGDYTVSDSNLAEIAAVPDLGNAARLKVREYVTDANTSALYHLNSDGTDSSANANTLTMTGTPTYDAGKLNNGLSLNGTTQYSTAVDSASLSLTGNQTVEGWFKPTASFSAGSSANQTILDKGNYKVYLDKETGKLTYEAENAGSKNAWAKQGGDKTNSSWTNASESSGIAYSSVANGMDLYVGLASLSTQSQSIGDAEVWKVDTTDPNNLVWTKIGGDGINSSWADYQFEYVTSMEIYGTDLYVGLGYNSGDAEVWRRPLAGGTWTKVGGDGVLNGWADITFESVNSLEVFDGNLYAGLGNSAADGEVWRFNGSTWGGAFIGGDGTGWAASTYEEVSSLYTYGDYLYAGLGSTGGDAELWRYNGSWQQVGGDDTALNDRGWGSTTYEAVYSLTELGGKIYAGLGNGTNDADVFEYDPVASTWSTVFGGDGVNGSWSTEGRVRSLANDGTNLYAGIGSNTSQGTGDLYKYSAGSWTKIGGDDIGWASSLFDGVYTISVITNIDEGKDIYAGIGYTQSNAYGYSEVWRLSNSSWTKIGGDNINSSWTDKAPDNVKSMVDYKGSLYAGIGYDVAGDAEVWKFNGTSWTQLAGNGVGPFPVNTYFKASSMIVFNGKLYVGMGGAANLSDVWEYDGSTWTQIGGDGIESSWAGANYDAVYSMAVYNNQLCAGIGHATTSGRGQIYCMNTSNVWSQLTTIGSNGWVSSTNVESLIVYNGDFYAGQYGGAGQIYKYSGSPASWTKVAGGGTNSSWSGPTDVFSMAVYNGQLYAGVGGQSNPQVWRFNGTDTWTQVGGSSLNNGWANTEGSSNYSLVVFNGRLYATNGWYYQNSPKYTANVYEYDGSTWTKIGGSNLNGSWNETFADAAVVAYPWHGKLYVGMGHYSTANNAVVYSMGDNALLASSTTSWDTNWHHYSITYDGATFKMNIDGVEQSTLVKGMTIPDGNSSLYVGHPVGFNSTDGQSYFAGMLDEIRLSNSVRTSFNTSTYTSDSQTVTLDTAVLTSGVKGWTGFSATNAIDTVVKFRLSHDDGATWEYYADGAWGESDSIAEANTIAEVNTNIPSFDITTDGIKWQAVITGNGEQTVDLSNVTISYDADTDDPTNPTAASGTHATNWNSNAHPEFVLSGAGDGSGSGVDGYYVYFGTSASADPESTSGVVDATGSAVHYQTSSTVNILGTLTPGTYHLRVSTKDEAGNISSLASAADFVYNFDGTAPINTSHLTVSPSGYSASNSFTFMWTAGSDPNSGLKEYQYRVRKPGDIYTDWTTATARELTFIDALEGTNTFFVKTIDNANNESGEASVNFYYNASAPSAPLVHGEGSAVPASNTENAFAFRWLAPESYQGEASGLTYYYSINVTPTVNNVSSNGNSIALAEGAFATQQGTNNLYVVAKDNAGNINYSAYLDIPFEAVTTAPGQPVTVNITDSSSRETTDYRITVTWSAPTSGGTVNHYKIYKSVNNVDYSSPGTTSSTGYIDSGLDTAITYYYKVTALDSAGAESADSSVVSLQPTGKYIDPPHIESGPTVSVTSATVTVAWVTDREASGSLLVYDSTGDTLISEQGSSDFEIDHSIKVDQITPITAYKYVIKSTDVDGNVYESDKADISTTDAVNLTGATVTVGASSLKAIWTTSVLSTSSVLIYDSTGNTLAMEQGSTEKVLDHNVSVIGLSASATYYYLLKSIDTEGNVYQTDSKVKIATAVAPAIAKVDIVDRSLTSATFNITTSTIASLKILYGTTTSYGSEISESYGNSNSKTHSIRLASLAPGTIYYYRVLGTDSDNNELRSDGSFATPAKPAISSLQFQPITNEPTTTYDIVWETNVPTSSSVVFSSNGKENKSSARADLETDHILRVKNLEDQTTYQVTLSGRDKYGNYVEYKAPNIVTPIDSRPPKISNMVIEVKAAGAAGSSQKSQVVVSWQTDEAATSSVEYGQGMSGEYPSKTQQDAIYSTSHVVIISELETSKIYHLRAVSYDQSGNKTASSDTTVITGKTQKSVLDIILNTMINSFSWLSKIFN